MHHPAHPRAATPRLLSPDLAQRALRLCGALLLGLLGCSGDPEGDPLDAFLPALPPKSGAAVARAGRLTAENYSKERITGPSAQGLVGDYFLANDRIRVVVQQPGRTISPMPYGGNIIDMDFVDQPVGDSFGKVGLFMLTGRTAKFTDAEVVRDGAAGGPAVLRFRGADVLDDYVNVVGLGGIAGIIDPALLPDTQLGLKLAVTYILNPGESHVRTVFTFYNPSGAEVSTSWGTLSETGGALLLYHPGMGYGTLSVATLLTGNPPMVEYLVQQGPGVSYGIIPQRGADGVPHGVAFPVTGVAIELYDMPERLSPFQPSGLSVVLPPQQGQSREVAVAIARGGADGIERLVRTELTKEALRTVKGVLRGTTAGESIQIGVLRDGLKAPYNGITGIAVQGLAGETPFTTQLVPGSYQLLAEGGGRRRSAPISVQVGAGDVEAPPLVLPAPALLSYKIVDETGAALPGKVTVLGQSPEPIVALTSPYELDAYDNPHRGIVVVRHSLAGTSGEGSRFDQPIALLAGDYRVVVSRGPEYSRFEQRITLAAGESKQVSAVLQRVVDTSGYLACDFHQHTLNSPDSQVPLEDRVVTNLSEGVEFVSTSDHDFISDFKPVIKALGADRLMDSVPGSEITPFAYGHFIAWPFTPDPLSPNGGSFDWGGGEELDIAPAGIFRGARARGAQVVQINHPRAFPRTTFDFLYHFDRAELAFDWSARTFSATRAAMKLSPLQLGLPEDAEVFSPTFDALELWNGTRYGQGPRDRDGERRDTALDRMLFDWMNFLSFGFTPTATGNSDTHGRLIPTGTPRTLVRVPNDGAAALQGGVGADVARTMLGQGGAPRDVVVTNGPMLRFYSGSEAQGGIGRTLTPTAGKLKLVVEAQAAEWSPLDTLEIFANSTFDAPKASDITLAPMVPVVCFSTAMLSERCRGALYSGTVTEVRTTLAPGQVRLSYKLEVEVEVAKLLTRNRAGARGQDLWLVARAFGDRALYPVLASGLDEATPLSAILAGDPLLDTGVFPMALTNPIYVDVDGNGWRAPFQP